MADPFVWQVHLRQDVLDDAMAELRALPHEVLERIVEHPLKKKVVRSGPRNLDSGLSEISIVFQAAVPKPVTPKYTTSGVRRPSEL